MAVSMQQQSLPRMHERVQAAETRVSELTKENARLQGEIEKLKKENAARFSSQPKILNNKITKLTEKENNNNCDKLTKEESDKRLEALEREHEKARSNNDLKNFSYTMATSVAHILFALGHWFLHSKELPD